MRKRLLFVPLILSAILTAGFGTVAASTDCDRWLQQYKEQLANSAPVKQVKSHVHHLLHGTPKPHLLRTSAPVYNHVVHPKLTPQEMLRRFHVLCGDLPPESVPFSPALLVGPPFSAPPTSVLTASEAPPVGLAPPVAALTPTDTTTRTPVTSPLVPFVPIVPIGSSPIVPITPQPTTPRSPTSPSSPTYPSSPIAPTSPTSPIYPSPVTPTPAVPVVPEPSSIILMLTGLGGIILLSARRRLQPQR